MRTLIEPSSDQNIEHVLASFVFASIIFACSFLVVSLDRWTTTLTYVASDVSNVHELTGRQRLAHRRRTTFTTNITIILNCCLNTHQNELTRTHIMSFESIYFSVFSIYIDYKRKDGFLRRFAARRARCRRLLPRRWAHRRGCGSLGSHRRCRWLDTAVN